MSDLQIYLTLGIFASVILVIAFDVIDMVIAALLGVSLMFVFGILGGKEILSATQTAGGTACPAVRRDGGGARTVENRHL